MMVDPAEDDFFPLQNVPKWKKKEALWCDLLKIVVPTGKKGS